MRRLGKAAVSPVQDRAVDPEGTEMNLQRARHVHLASSSQLTNRFPHNLKPPSCISTEHNRTRIVFFICPNFFCLCTPHHHQTSRPKGKTPVYPNVVSRSNCQRYRLAVTLRSHVRKGVDSSSVRIKTLLLCKRIERFSAAASIPISFSLRLVV